MNGRSRFSKGQILVLFTLVLPVLLAVMGLGTDLGLLYFNWSILQKSADSAALAGAEYLIANPAPPTPPATASGCPAYASGDTVGGPKSVACTYATFNGAKSSEFTPNVPAPNPPNGISPTIRVVLDRPNLPTYFLRFVGLGRFDVKAQATAVGPTAVKSVGNGMFPVGMPQSPSNQNCLNPSQPSNCFGTVFSLTADYSPGNTGFLNIPSGFVGSNTPGSAPHGGGANQLASNIQNGCTCTVSIGDYIFPKPGVQWGPVSSAFNSRTGGTSQNLSGPGDSLTPAEASSKRLVTVPIVSWDATNGSSKEVQVLGFAEVWLVDLQKSGSNVTMTVQFVRYKSAIATTGAGANNFGALTPPYLVQ
jgi:hypothetical protein